MSDDLFIAESELPTTTFSPCRLYRYSLWRTWSYGFGYVLFIGLNPSTADELNDDPTIRRCVDFAKRWGYRALCMANLFAYRATSPKDMKLCADPIGPDNDAHLRTLGEQAGMIVAAWGNDGSHRGRDIEVRRMFAGRLHCLGMTDQDQPKHPLYLPKETTRMQMPNIHPVDRIESVRPHREESRKLRGLS